MPHPLSEVESVLSWKAGLDYVQRERLTRSQLVAM